MKIGLVLEGGGMRGMFTAGVLDVLMDENIWVDGIVSVSAGALFGANYPSRQRGRVIRYNLKYINDKRYIGLRSLLTTGNIINKEFAFYEVPVTLDPFDNAAFKASAIDFYVTLTNVESGLAEYVKITDVFAQMELLRATSAMPFVSKMIEFNGNKYLDGGIADSIPLTYCQSLGYDKIIVILTRPFDYRKTAANRYFINAFYRKYPNLVDTLSRRHLDYNRRVEEIIRLHQQNWIFVIRPSVSLPIGRIEKDLNKIQAMYELGVNDGIRELDNLTRYLNHSA
ncbi:patatin-like phospholipase family protein [Necropsobacter massiliensis]|uniref:patatin-like phospholipase family protein n=1 Tax=Necropsobacter massiliensis TaxID=1400001 RepID=UPI000596258E|nr:patatin-like phospholipase family protein [Necropsobacter massiliensis]